MSIAPALVPQELRPRRTQLWLPAGRTTWASAAEGATQGGTQRYGEDSDGGVGGQ